MSEKFEIKNINDLLNVFENTDGYYLGDYSCFQIANYIRKMCNQLQQKENIIKEVREYINAHKQKTIDSYEDELEDYEIELWENEINDILQILDKDNKDE